MDIVRSNSNYSGSPEKRWFKRPFVYILIICIVLVFYFGLNIFSNVLDIAGKEGKKVFDPNPIPQQEADRLDVLILGNSIGRTDGSLTDTGALLTDSIMVLSFDKKTKKAAMISIPRDLYLDDFVTNLSNGKQIHLTGKINEMYPKGLANNQKLDFDKNIISKITGIYIDKVVVFNLDSFKTIVDSIGGIDIHLDKPFSEPKQWTYPFNLPAGDNHLSGEQALYYVRSRYSSNDFDRARRQQDVIKAVKAKATSTGLISNPTKIISLFSSLNSNIKTDFQIWNINDLISLVNSSGNGAIKDYLLTTDNLLDESHTASGEYILLPKGNNFDGIKAFFKNIINPN